MASSNERMQLLAQDPLLPAKTFKAQRPYDPDLHHDTASLRPDGSEYSMGLRHVKDMDESVRFALEQLTIEQDLTGDFRSSASSNSSSSYSDDLGIPDQGNAQPYPIPLPDPIPLRVPSRTQPDNMDYSDGEEGDLKDTLPGYIPCSPPEASSKHKLLDYTPGALRAPVLALFGMVSLLAAALLIWGAVKSKSVTGLAVYDSGNASQYFLFRYLPQLLAGLFHLALQPIESAITRVAPYSAMSSQNPQLRSRSQFMPLYKTNYYLPPIGQVLDGFYVIGLASLAMWLNAFSVPLLSSLFQISYTPDSRNIITAKWTASLPVIYILVIIFVLLAISLFGLANLSLVRSFGLKWFPTSIADIITLIHHSNLVRDYQGTETLRSNKEFEARLGMRSHRLGYWQTHDQTKDIFYGIAEEGAPPRRYSVVEGRATESRATTSLRNFGEVEPVPTADPEETQEPVDLHSPEVRFAHIAWFLTDGAVVAWIVVSIGFYVALLAVSFTHEALQKGFDPMTPIDPDHTAFSPATFLYSFLPSFLGVIISQGWRCLDMTYRALQPWANLATRQGAPAKETLLLDYTQNAPGIVTARALKLGDYKVALISFVSLLATFVPIISGGMFLPVLDLIYFSKPLVRLHVPAFVALLVVLTVLVLASFALFPTRKRYLPHAIQTISEVISFLYASPLVDETAFRDPVTKSDMVAGLIGDRHDDVSGGGFAFGVFIGRDGKDHLGVDRIWRDVPVDGSTGKQDA